MEPAHPNKPRPKRTHSSPGDGSIYQRTKTRTRKDGTIVTSTYWVAALSLPGTGKRVTFQGKTRSAVRDKLMQARAELTAHGRVANGRQRLSEFLEEWLAAAKPSVKASTHAAYTHYTRAHLIPGLGPYPLTKLGPEHVQRFLNAKLADGMAPQTVRHVRAILRRALNIAIRWGRIHRNAAELVDPPRVPKRKQRRLTPEQARGLLAAFRAHRLGALFTLALGLGMRQGQALGLRWDDVKFESGVIHLETALIRIDGAYVLDDPKTDTSAHVLPLPEPLADVLRAHRTRQREERLAAGPKWVDSGLVFTTVTGSPLNRSVVTHQFQSLLPAAKVPHMSFHDLRGSCATLLAVLGIHPRVAMEILGHADFATTMRYYTDALSDSQKEAMDRLGVLLWGENEEGLRT
jgi:integrase